MNAKAARKLNVAILGSGNIGTDLAYKILRNSKFDLRMVSGIDPSSEGLARARELKIPTSADGVEAILEEKGIDLVFEATSAKAHMQNAPRFEACGIRAIDLTPAKVGPSVVPCVNLDNIESATNVNLISCAAQATIPIVYGFSQAGKVHYSEIVATIASKGAGKGARDNIEEFTHTTARALADIGGATRGKAMVVLNPADPPLIMRNTIYAVMDEDTDDNEVRRCVNEMVEKIQRYVPGYRMVVEPFRRGDHYMTTVEVKGAGDYLPTYAGNLDIINAAAIAVAERFADRMAYN